MSDLQATFEFSIELYKFYNVDLFQRGLYQIRVGLRVSPKVPVQIEVSVANNVNQPRGGRIISGASLINGLGASKPFQILYRNEEVTLRDTVQFRAHLLVDSRNLKESLERAEWSVGIELWCGDSATTLAPAACRVLKLHFQPSQGLHYHLPVLFDYFHLAAVSITIHACLVALHQPYINTPRSSKQWGKLVRSAGNGGISLGSTNSATLESVLFGSSGVKCSGSSSRIAHARQVHAEVCRILLGSLEGLQNALAICGSAGTALTPEASTNTIVGDVTQRLKDITDSSKNETNGPGLDEEEEFACGAAHDIARLCAEVTLRWRSFLRVAADRPHVHHALAARHHALRIKRFAECFFVLDNPRHSLAGCYDSNYQSYQSVGDAVRRSRYLALLPPLPVHCIALDGDSHIMPIIFEDRYQDTAEFARRRSVVTNGNTSGSDPFLSIEPIGDDCACSIMDSRRPSSAASRSSQSTTVMDVMEPKINPHQQNIVKASLTLAPKPMSPKRNATKQALKEKQRSEDNEVTGHSRFVVQNNQINEIEMVNPNRFISGNVARNKILSRFSASTLLDIENHVFDKKTQPPRVARNAPSHFVSNGINSLPTRHSKSLDQLRISNFYSSKLMQQIPPQISNNLLQGSMNYGAYIPQKPSTLPRNLASVAHSHPHFPPFHPGYNTIKLHSTERNEEYSRNINEFREKYKNPCGAVQNFNRGQYGCMEQGNRVSNFVRNPLELQRGPISCSPHPQLPPRNSYPPVSGKHQHSIADYNAVKQIHRSNSTHVFPQKTDNRIIQYDPSSGELRIDSNQYFLGKAQWNYNDRKKMREIDNGLIFKIDKKKSQRSSKTPPPNLQVAKHKKTKTREQSKLHHSARELSKLNSSKDSLSSRHSSKSRDGSDRNTPKSTRSEKKPRHRASERMSQQISEASTSSSTESIPIAARRLESSASVPYRLDRGVDNLRHCRSAASVLDEPSLTGSVFSESLPNLAPPPAFDSPMLDIADENFKILPPDTFKNEYDSDRKRASPSTSSLSEQSGWVSSGKSTDPSTPEISPSKKNPEPSAVGEFLHTVLNGEQLRQKLMKLAIKVAKDKENAIRGKIECDQCNNCRCDSICTNAKCEFDTEVNGDPYAQCDDCRNELIATEHPQYNFSQAKTLPNIVNGLNANVTVKKSVTENFHPYIRKEIPISVQLPSKEAKSSTLDKNTLKNRIEYTDKLLAAEIRSLTMDRILRDHTNISSNDKIPIPSKRMSKVEKCKSEMNLAHSHLDGEDVFKLPPPQQFRDVPPPPDAFKDPPPKQAVKHPVSRSSSKSKTPTPTKSTTPTKTRLSEPLQLDNPLYHVCEGVRERRKARIPHTVSNGAAIPPAMSKSQSTGELAAREEGTDPKDKCEKSLVSVFGLAESERLFIKCRDEFRHSVKYPGSLYSDFPPVDASLPYFHISDEYRMFNPEGLHLIICVHGLDGNSADLRLVKTYLELGLPGAHLEFLMSERNQGDTFSDFDTMTERLVDEITQHIKTLRLEPARISFVGHSLGTIIIRSALARPQIKPLLPRLHTFLSLSGPHLGTLYNSSGLVNAGMWFMQKWKRSGSLLQLSLRDAPEPRRAFLYRLSERSQLHRFKHVLLCGSGQDRYVPLHSARLELCKAAAKDASPLGQAYREMVHNLVSPLAGSSGSGAMVVRYEAQHALPHTASALVGRAAHIAALDSDLFIEKFLLVSALKYFR